MGWFLIGRFFILTFRALDFGAGGHMHLAMDNRFAGTCETAAMVPYFVIYILNLYDLVLHGLINGLIMTTSTV